MHLHLNDTLVKLQLKPIHLFLFFFSPIANELGDHLGKQNFRVGEANIGHMWQFSKIQDVKPIF